MPVVMREVQTWDELENIQANQGGEYMMVDRSPCDPLRTTHGTRYPIIVCPRCKRPGACSNHTLVQEQPLTIRASYLCGQRKLGGSCRFHAMITDGVMTEC
jgi:hypothetical protein